MKIRVSSLCFVTLLILAVLVSTSKATIPSPPGPHEYVAATTTTPRTVDPAKAYDLAAEELISNVYETLIDYKTLNDFMGVSTNEFAPELATSWNISTDGLTYTFQVRSCVTFHDGSPLSPVDVEYSFERAMIRDPAGGPIWMLYEPLIGTYGSRYYPGVTDPDPAVNGPAREALGHIIDNAVTRDDVAGTVAFHLLAPYGPFMQILVQTWSSVVSEAYMTRTVTFPGGAVDTLDWSGDWGDYRSWWAFNNYAREMGEAYFARRGSPLDGGAVGLNTMLPSMMGTGPYKFDHLTTNVEWSIVKFDGYWGGWGWGNTRRGFRSRGYITRVTMKVVTSWASAYSGFIGTNPIYDSIYVPRQNISQVWQKTGTECIYPFISNTVEAMLFSYNVTTISPYIGQGILPGFTFNETGIRPDFFSDVHARRAVAYSFNWTKYIMDAFYAEGKQSAIPVPEMVKFFDSSLPKYSINLTKATEEWKLAWGGTPESSGPVWTNGFYFQIPYPTAESTRHSAAQILEATIESTNPKFHVDAVEEPWGRWLDDMSYDISPTEVRSIIPIFIVGWLTDFLDMHNYAVPFMASDGNWATLQDIKKDPLNPRMEQLIEWGLRNTTDAGRKRNYDELWRLYIQQVPSIPTVQTYVRRWERDWVQGWYYNPVVSGTSFYSTWKEELPRNDVDANGRVEIKDLSIQAKAYGSYYVQPFLPPYPKGPPGYYTDRWNSQADTNQDMKVDMKDIAWLARLFGYSAPPWTPP